MYLGLPKERGNTFFKMTAKIWVLVDANLNKIASLHGGDCLLLYLQVGAFFSSFCETCTFLSQLTLLNHIPRLIVVFRMLQSQTLVVLSDLE